jgi:hypothetical protein
MISANCVAGRDRGKGLPVLWARQFIGAATTALSLITGAFLLALAAGNARAQGSAPACDAAGEIALLPSPWAPWKRSPWQNGLVERLIGSVRHECTDHVIVFNEDHLRRILSKYASHYNEVRTHLSLGKDAPCTRPIERFGDIIAQPILGGLHHRYARI